MHKLYLTPEECSVISNSKQIIDAFGGFPAMDNAEISHVSVGPSTEAGRYDCSIEFNVEKWAERNAVEQQKTGIQYVTITFSGCLDFEISGDAFLTGCGEIKFGDKPDKRDMHQDDLPEEDSGPARPFCTFYARNGRGLCVWFEEETCRIIASARN